MTGHVDKSPRNKRGMSESEVSELRRDIAVMGERFKSIDERLKRLEALIFGTGGAIVLGLLYSILTHQITLP